MSKRLDPEIKALRALGRALHVLQPDERARIAQWAYDRYVRDVPEIKAMTRYFYEANRFGAR